MAAKKSRLVQVEFQHEDFRKLVWVEALWNLKTGDKVTFDDDNSIWQVIEVYGILIEAESIYSKWGLGLPKTFRTEK